MGCVILITVAHTVYRLSRKNLCPSIYQGGFDPAGQQVCSKIFDRKRRETPTGRIRLKLMRRVPKTRLEVSKLDLLAHPSSSIQSPPPSFMESQQGQNLV